MKIYWALLVSCSFISYSFSNTLPPFLLKESTKAYELLQILTLDQKIGQLFMVAAISDESENQTLIERKPYRMDTEYIKQLIEKYHIGGIICFGKYNPETLKNHIANLQQLTTIPLLIGMDLEPGRVGKAHLPNFFDFPTNENLGKESDDFVYQTGIKIGLLCKSLGIHINFAPVADVNNNPNNPVINNRSFGNTPELVAQKAIAFMRGLQDTGIIACAKHFPGHGDTNVDSHFDLPLISHDQEHLHAIELSPFKQLIKYGIDSIMVGHLEIPAFENRKNLPSSISENIVTHLLQNKLSFNGLIITDALDMNGVARYFKNGDAELQALLAGNDILLCPINVSAAVEKIKQALNDGAITQAQLDGHVLKILQAKEYIHLI